MQRWTALAFGLVFVGAIVLVVMGSGGAGGAVTATAASASASGSAAPHEAASAVPSDAGPALAIFDAGAPQVNEDPGSPIDTPLLQATNDAGATLISGDAPPTLAADAPKSVVVGVILVQYRGAQGAAPNARTHEAALALAKQIAEDAKTDFKAAIAKGDKGSSDNVGRMQRGYLEPAPEYVVFSLAKDAVSEPVDTPRGYWIVKRIE